MGRDNKIPNALKRSEVHRKRKREKEQSKLKRRIEVMLVQSTYSQSLTSRPAKQRSKRTEVKSFDR